MISKKIFLIPVRLLIGLMFLTTAILKLISIDQFEIYIYSFNIFSFGFTAIVARLLIFLEFLLGSFLIFKIQYKKIWWLTLLIMIGFTLFLIYVALFRNDTNCHCFGEFIELNPTHSIIKNLITILLLFIVKNETENDYKGKKIFLWGIPALSFLVTFIIFPPDSLYNQFRSEQNNFDTEFFKKLPADTSLYSVINNIEYLNENDTVIFSDKKEIVQLDSGKYIMVFMTSGCKYCKISLTKLNSIFEKHNLNNDRCIIWIWGRDTSSISRFIKTTGGLSFKYNIIDPYAAIDLVFGHFPTFVIIDNNKVVKVLDYRELSENELKEYFAQ